MKRVLPGKQCQKRIGGLILVIALVLALGTGCGQTTVSQIPNDTQIEAVKYPTRPVTLIVPWGPGGGADQLARMLSKELGNDLGVSFPVVNVPGASGSVGLAKLVNEPADGYNIAIYTLDSHATLSGASPSFKFEDIIPVARMVKATSYLYVSMNSPIKTWADFEKMAKEKPGQMKMAITGDGTVDDISISYLEKKLGIKVNKIPLSNPGERYVSIIGGHADVLFEQAGDVAQYLDQKQMRPILIFNEKRVSEYPDIPSTGELGLKIYLPFSRTIIAKAGTPPDQIKVLSDALKNIYDTSDEFKKFLKNNYASEDSFVGSEVAKKALEEDLTTMKEVLGK